MNHTKIQIKLLSAQAAEFSQKATTAFKEQKFSQGQQFMAQAVTASKNCQLLIQEYKKATANSD